MASISLTIQYQDGTTKGFSIGELNPADSDTTITRVVTQVNALNKNWTLGDVLQNENGSNAVGIAKASYTIETDHEIPLSDEAMQFVNDLRTEYGSDTALTTIQVISTTGTGKEDKRTYNHINPRITAEQADALGKKLTACSNNNYADTKVNKTWSTNETLAE